MSWLTLVLFVGASVSAVSLLVWVLTQPRNPRNQAHRMTLLEVALLELRSRR